MLITRRSFPFLPISARRASSQSGGRAATRHRLQWGLVACLALALLLPAAASGALDLSNIDNLTTQIATSTTISWNHATGAAGTNRLLLVFISTRGGSSVLALPAPTYGTQTLTFLGARNNDSNPLTRIEIWYLTNPNTGSNLITFTLSASTNIIGTALSLTGVNQTDPLLLVGASAFQSSSSTGGGDAAPALTAASTPGDMVISGITTQGSVISFTSGNTLLWSQFNGTNAAGTGQSGSAALGAASVPVSWTLGASSRWALGAVSVRPAVTISGTVFEDADFSGTAAEYDGGASATGDRGLPNVDVELYDGVTNAYITSVATAANGTYSFSGLSNGTYKVRVRSATIGDADTLPRGGLNGTVPGTWPYPLPELAWANGAPLYGGVSADVDDTVTGDNNGPGDTYAPVTAAGSDVLNVNFGFAYNLIVNVQDDNRNDATRSTQGSVRQFMKNANAVGQANSTTASSSQFRMQVAANQSSGGDAWWRLTVANRDLPVLGDTGTLLDGSTQRLNSGLDSNTLGPEIEVTGFGTAGTSVGLRLTGSAITVREVAVASYSLTGIRIDGSNNRVEGCYVGTDAIGSTGLGMGGDGILITGSGNTIGGTAAGEANLVAYNSGDGIFLVGSAADGNILSGNAVFANGGLGIDLDPDGVGAGGGANNDKAAPVITSAASSGTDFVVTAAVSSGDVLELFRANNTAAPVVAPDATGSGEGYLYLGRCVDNGACSGPYVAAAADGDGTSGIVQATLLSGGVVPGDRVTATATNAADGSSEFSTNRVLPVTLALVKQAWLENGSAALSSPLTAPVGSAIVFLIYVKNTSAITATDVRISDLLDEAAFGYTADSLVRTSAASPPADTATDLEIFSATANGTGTNLSDSVDGDAASALDTDASTNVDRITAGAAAGQANAVLDIAAHTTFAIRFAVVVR